MPWPLSIPVMLQVVVTHVGEHDSCASLRTNTNYKGTNQEETLSLILPVPIPQPNNLR